MNLFNALIKSGHFYGQTNADVEVGIQTRFVITNVFSQTFHICLGEEQVSLAQAWLDLEGVIYLETSHWGRKEKTF